MKRTLVDSTVCHDFGVGGQHIPNYGVIGDEIISSLDPKSHDGIFQSISLVLRHIKVNVVPTRKEMNRLRR